MRDSETDPNILSPQTVKSEEIIQVELVETLSSDLSSGSDLIAVENKKAATMSVSESSEATRRLQVVSEFERNLKHAKQKLLFRLTNFTEEDLDNDTVGDAEARLREFDDEYASISVSIQDMIEQYSVELGESKVTQWEATITDLVEKVKAYAKRIKARIRQIVSPTTITSLEKVMLAAQKATAKSQNKLVQLEVNKQAKEKKEGHTRR